MNRPLIRISGPQKQKGASLLMVLVVLTLLLLGAGTLARQTSNSTFLAGNVASKEAARQAAEIGVSEAFARLRDLGNAGNLEANNAGWYRATSLATEVPAAAQWAQAAVVQAGSYEVRYIVERLCQGPLPVTNAPAQCFVRQLPSEGSAKVGAEKLQAVPSLQYRISVQVQGVKNTQSLVQAMVNL